MHTCMHVCLCIHACMQALERDRLTELHPMFIHTLIYRDTSSKKEE